MKLKKKSKLLLFLFLAVLFQQLPVYSQSYVITEEQLEQLEQNNERLKKLLNERQAELNEREKEIENLKTLSNQMMQSLNRSEKEKQTIKTLAFIGGGVCLVGGILFGAWIVSINK